MIVVASGNGSAGIGPALDILRAGGSALDAVEAATRVIERAPDDHTVGVGGYPNILGEVELDASLMEGTTRRAGAVAALRGYAHPVSVARAILEHLPQHVLLVGDGAARFAAERGFEPEELLTEPAAEAWRRKVAGLPPVEGEGGGKVPVGTQATLAQDPAHVAGTVNFIARDGQGRIASAVSTSGWAFKYPGRVGDSPLVGAGNYCDDRWGACACTGLGEWAIRAGVARSIVLGMEFGLTLSAACVRAMNDLRTLPLPEGARPVMNLIALDARGAHAGYALDAERDFYRSYCWQTADLDEVQTAPCIPV